jgi:murein DD-endopeptidase MepM/ murein hydrolase activator NlpD
VPFLQSAAADQQVSTAISSLAESGAPAGLPSSAARMSSEAVRAQLWRPAPPEAARAVVVREGQSLWDIAAAWGISVQTIAAANGLANAELVRPGQRLLIPVASDPDAPAKLAEQAAEAVIAAKAARTATPARSGRTTPSPTGSPTVVLNEGQTLWSLARAHGVSVASILEANDLGDATRIRAGTRLVIPGHAVAPQPSRVTAARTQSGQKPLTVTLGEGQTLWSLARAHGTTVEAIVAANGLGDANRVRAGRRLIIPGRTASQAARVATTRAATQRAGEAFMKASTTAVRIARGFLWPARGQLTSRFGWRRWRHHDGIDIAAPYGSPIYAARPGRVVFAGWYYAYGRAVIVDHGNGVQTLYGHASKLLVRTGETVSQGQLIARVGASGRATGPHVHFEVRVNGRAVNPMKYMD